METSIEVHRRSRQDYEAQNQSSVSIGTTMVFVNLFPALISTVSPGGSIPIVVA